MRLGRDVEAFRTSNIEHSMRILMISAEGPPLQRTGALIDVMDALPSALRARGHEVSVALPYYREIRENRAFKEKDTGVTVDVQLGDKTYVAKYLEGRSAGGVQLFLVRCDEFFDRPGIYGERSQAYEDNATRFIFFCKAALELARRLTPALQILHVHDWAAALVPVFVRAHNLPLTTVSEHYRREIQTPSGGCGLDVVLRENAHRLMAILHGADYTRWNPASDRLLPAHYDPRRLRGKETCREALLKQLKLASASRGPVFGMVTRVVEEKGFEILMPLLDRLLWDDVRLIILGEGDPTYETALGIAARKFPGKFVYRKDYDEKLAHLIEAGMNISLIPSRFEPAGLSAMYNLKYGALPVARATGGIQEIIEDFDPTMDSGYGFLCYEYSSDAFWDTIKRAREIYRDRNVWTKLMKRAMARNFSWNAAAQRYEELYRQLVGATDEVAA